MKPKVGLVMPVYKTDPEQLKTMLNSIYNQDYGFENLQLVISMLQGDALAWEHTKKTVVVYSNSVIQPPHFANVYSQIQAGLDRLEDCKYVYVAPSDDEYYPSKISKEVELAEEKDALAVYSDYEEWNEDLTKKFQDIELTDELTVDRIMRSNMISDTSLIRRDIFNLTIDPLMSRYTFWRFWLDLVTDLAIKGELDKIVHCKNMSFKYRIRGDGLHKKIQREGSYWNKDAQFQYHNLFLYKSKLADKLKEEGIECRIM